MRVCARLCLSVTVSLCRCVSPRIRVSVSRRPCSLCFCAVVRRCLRVAVSLCFCVPRWSLFKFQPWSIGQGWKIKKGPFSNTHNLFNLLSLPRCCAPSVAGPPHHCAEPMPTIHSHAVFFPVPQSGIMFQRCCVESCVRSQRDAGNAIENCK